MSKGWKDYKYSANLRLFIALSGWVETSLSDNNDKNNNGKRVLFREHKWGAVAYHQSSSEKQKKRARKYNQARHVYVTEEATNLFYVKFLVSRLWTTMPTSLSVV